MGVAPGLGLYKELLDLYASLHFLNADRTYNLTTVVEYTTGLLVGHGLKNTDQIQCVSDIYIYPKEYFCPVSVVDGKICLTKRTYTIHHFADSWVPNRKIRLTIRRIAVAVGGVRFKDILKRTFIKGKS